MSDLEFLYPPLLSFLLFLTNGQSYTVGRRVRETRQARNQENRWETVSTTTQYEGYGYSFDSVALQQVTGQCVESERSRPERLSGRHKRQVPGLGCTSTGSHRGLSYGNTPDDKQRNTRSRQTMDRKSGTQPPLRERHPWVWVLRFLYFPSETGGRLTLPHRIILTNKKRSKLKRNPKENGNSFNSIH